jgi:pimeloyl-ACP methyl ester carboxylesterase
MAYIPPHPVIVLPGITGTHLRDEYQIPPDLVWGVLQKDYPRLALHPDDPRYEAQEPARIQSDSIFDVAYKELVQELRYNLSKSEDQPVPVYPFGYDWRQPLNAIEEQLAVFVDEVIERTKLLRHYAAAGYADNPKVNLVGHSMGGIIITGYLERKGMAAPVAKVVTLATPFRGSFEAVIKVATGTANLGSDPPSSREREAARLMPSLYHLLPTVKDGLEIVGTSLPTTLFDPGLWQPGVVNTIDEYVRLHSVAKKIGKQLARDLFSRFLQDGQDHRNRLDQFRLSSTGLHPQDWLCVAGVNSVTRVKLKITKIADHPVFDLGSAYRLNEWENPNDPTRRHLTGDGTVPFSSAVPPFLEAANLVCVTPDDFGYWEIQDRLLSGVAGFHAILPNMDMLHRLIVRHFTGSPDPRRNTWGWPAPGVSDEQWKPPMELRNKRL